jgi:hypothetical protein
MKASQIFRNSDPKARAGLCHDRPANASGSGGEHRGARRADTPLRRFQIFRCAPTFLGPAGEIKAPF